MNGIVIKFLVLSYYGGFKDYIDLWKDMMDGNRHEGHPHAGLTASCIFLYCFNSFNANLHFPLFQC